MLLRQFRKTPEQRFTQEHSLFFRLLNRRYEKASIVLTSNKGFADWGRDVRRACAGNSDPGPAATSLNHAEYQRRELPVQYSRQTRGSFEPPCSP
nr:ATP-binding protein [Escherichia coli]